MRCPICRADNTQGPQCRRCRADLTLLFTLEEQRQRALADAGRFCAEGRLDEALAIAEGANALRRGADTQRLLAVIHLRRRDFAAAWRHYTAAAHLV